ncbi:MAG: tetratricopeptide repeat protein [Rickettsia endosymbiont of Pseudomimeciton antennatum]|nr:tetratricopeptide repeat protein [Rickettsia endosymbiont of Pseudomimeciton antennatum]
MELTYEMSHPNIAASLDNLWHVDWFEGQHELAIEYSPNSMKIMKLIYEEPNLDVVASLNSLWNAYKNKDLYEKGIEFHTKSLELMALLYKKDEIHQDIIFCLSKLALYHFKLGDTQKALNCLEQVSKMAKTPSGQDSPDIQYGANNNAKNDHNP